MRFACALAAAMGLVAMSGTASVAATTSYDGYAWGVPTAAGADVNYYSGVPYVTYYSPLEQGADCTYGVDCGTSADSTDTAGTGRTMTMNVAFDVPDEPVDAHLYVGFYDLDLAGVNDPTGFTEAFGVDGYGWVDDVNDPEVVQSYTNSYFQFLSFDLGTLTGPLNLDFLFNSTLSQSLFNGCDDDLDQKKKGKKKGKGSKPTCSYTNTPEKLVAYVGYTASPIPLPGGVWMLLGGMGLLGGVSVMRRRATV